MKEYWIYWFIGQPGSGKTSLAKKLQFWLQTDKANWRKSVFHIDEEDIRNLYDIDTDTTAEHNQIQSIAVSIASFANSKQHDVIVSTTSPFKEIREKYKKKYKIKEIYCDNKKIKDKIEFYEKPDQFYIHLDSGENVDETFKRLIKILI
ncbi:CysC Adenylylsulfate kinase and related kinases [uncultured Caudovirales phage]|uniref:CysC Adenylylsulfate kinase and related kinases n=1 Tax=uncultured Caudovirales phage TaxID=2100421 RepID=A0A6J5MI95_9CAUD|nr:CysC Adenylylsulfate kinase and related kinases [uncultured Caudovirales phage]